jgi:dipeptidyl-peptidase 4
MSRLSCIALLVSSLAIAQKLPVTLEVAARPSTRSDTMASITWAPDGRSFAYTTGKTLWVYDIPSTAKRELGSLSALEKAAAKADSRAPEPFAWENRRVSERKLQWTPDGRSLLITAEGDLFLWPVESGKWVQLTSTPEREHDPKLSPDGRLISFQRNNELHVLQLANRTTRRLTHDATATVWNGRLDWVYPEELDLGSAHWWSPDSLQIAFLQFDVSRQEVYPHAHLLKRDAIYEPQRYPKAGTPNAEVRLGVVPASGGKVTWADLGDPLQSLLARVDWLPDSKRVAVQRLNRIQTELALLFVDAATGGARNVLTERDPHWINIGNDLQFLDKREAFLWSSEMTGFRHLYLYSSDGRKLKQLTSGNWEVRSVVGLDEEQGVVYFHSRERSPLGSDLYSVSLNGGRRTLITPARGMHTVTMPRARAQYFIDLYASLTDAPRRTLHRITGDEIALLQPPDPAAGEHVFIKPEIVEVKTRDGALLYARLMRPAGFDAAKKYPAVVMVYGGPHAQNVCECYAGLNWEQALAQRGFVVWQLDNRGTAGRGKAFETKLFRRFGKQELEDQQAGIQHLLSMGFVDPKRIGMHGWSYGGFLTLYTRIAASCDCGRARHRLAQLRHHLHGALSRTATAKRGRLPPQFTAPSGGKAANAADAGAQFSG